MLKSIYISNFALITELHIDFEKGFSVLTGETGAGKSIILGALSLILGQRADTKAIKNDLDKCVIEAEFDVYEYHFIKDFFLKNDLDDHLKSCIIRREITNNGKSRAFVNDTPVSLNILRDLTIRLIDIHSQLDNLLLYKEHYLLEVVDTIAKNNVQAEAYLHQFNEWKQLLNDLSKLETNAKRYSTELDYIQFQYQQLCDAKLSENEQEELEQELETLTHAEEIKTELTRSEVLLDDENSTLPLLKETIHALTKVGSFIKDGEEMIERLQSAYIEIKDIKDEISAIAGNTEFNPDRLEFVETRLSDLYTLQKKYKVASNEELIQIRDDFGEQLQRIESFDEDIENLKIKIQETFEQLKVAAEVLTQSRVQVIETIENHMVEQLAKLGMPNIQFKVDIQALSEYTESGIDEIQFLFSANKNRPVQPVQQIASGGEVSRVMLSIKSLMADKSDLPTIIFDEIDTGVSGEIASRMGEIMQIMSDHMQVITITHLPQIAAKSAHHYRVFKDDSGFQTETKIQRLVQDERVMELSQMLSGNNVTPASIQNAKELLGI